MNEVYTNAYKDYKEFIKINQYSENKKIIIRPHPSDRKFKNWKMMLKLIKMFR